MFPLHKLEKLPRSQRLRKICKLFGEAENSLCRGLFLSAEQLSALAGSLNLLIGDSAFSQAASAAFRTAQADLKAGPVLQNAMTLHGAAGQKAAVPVRRAVNTVRHLLLAETGHAPADWDFIDGEGKPDLSKRRAFPGMIVYLEDIRSPFNVGAMFRSAESFGAEKLLLSPFCADPGHPRAERSAMGCIAILPWERLQADLFSPAPAAQVPNLVQNSDYEKFPVFALETGGVPVQDFAFPSSGIMITGSEELGVSPAALAAADHSLGRVSIETYGVKGSLNVSVAFGIAMQAWAAALTSGRT
jgi:TrmH family RNA methyltransferase